MLNSKYTIPRTEINDVVRENYLKRLGGKLKKMRRLSSERKWADLRQECLQLQQTSSGFGLQQIAHLASEVVQRLPSRSVPTAVAIPGSQRPLQQLFLAMDQLIPRQDA